MLFKVSRSTELKINIDLEETGYLGHVQPVDPARDVYENPNRSNYSLARVGFFAQNQSQNRNAGGNSGSKQTNLLEVDFRTNTHDGNRPSGRKQQTLAHQKFGMTPFDQQNAQNLQSNFAIVDQKIEERESLRHSTHRSQRSERLAGNNQSSSNQPIPQY